MRKKHWNLNIYQAHSLWYEMKDLQTEEEKDSYLEHLGLARIEKPENNFFIITNKPNKKYIYKPNYKSNLKIIDEHKFFLAKIKYGI